MYRHCKSKQQQWGTGETEEAVQAGTDAEDASCEQAGRDHESQGYEQHRPQKQGVVSRSAKAWEGVPQASAGAYTGLNNKY